MNITNRIGIHFTSVSYTHLDVYKRQSMNDVHTYILIYYAYINTFHYWRCQQNYVSHATHKYIIIWSATRVAFMFVYIRLLTYKINMQQFLTFLPYHNSVEIYWNCLNFVNNKIIKVIYYFIFKVLINNFIFSNYVKESFQLNVERLH